MSHNQFGVGVGNAAFGSVSWLPGWNGGTTTGGTSTGGGTTPGGGTTSDADHYMCLTEINVCAVPSLMGGGQIPGDNYGRGMTLQELAGLQDVIGTDPVPNRGNYGLVSVEACKMPPTLQAPFETVYGICVNFGYTVFRKCVCKKFWSQIHVPKMDMGECKWESAPFAHESDPFYAPPITGRPRRGISVPGGGWVPQDPPGDKNHFEKMEFKKYVHSKDGECCPGCSPPNANCEGEDRDCEMISGFGQGATGIPHATCRFTLKIPPKELGKKTFDKDEKVCDLGGATLNKIKEKVKKKLSEMFDEGLYCNGGYTPVNGSPPPPDYPRRPPTTPG